MPSLTQLKYIVTVDRLGHFAKAANICRVTQPSLSIQVQKAEEELGIVIFDRNKKPVKPTFVGEHIIKQAKIILQEYEKLMTISKDGRNEIAGELKIGIIPTILPYLLPLFIKQFSEKYPKVHLTIEEMKTVDIVDTLRSDDIDAGILATPLLEKGIREKVLYYEEFFVYFHKGHPLSLIKHLDPNQLEAKDVWLIKDGHCLRNQVTHLCLAQGSSPTFQNFHFEGGSLETLRNLIKTSRGFTLVPWTFVRQLPQDEQENHTKGFSYPIPLREVSLVYRRDLWKKNLIEALCQTISGALPRDIKKTYEPDHYRVIGIN